MMWILRKELRDLAPALALVALGMLVAGFPLAFELRALEAYLWCSVVAGLVVGAFQAWLDHGAERDAFLRHRALSALRIRAARTAAGALALVVVALLPWVGLLLLPGRHGRDLWADAVPPEAHGDLEAWHVPIAWCFAVLPWSLARFAGSLRRPWVRPVAGVALVLIAYLAVASRDQGPRLAVLVAGSAVAVAAVLFPAREVRGTGAVRLLRPAALLALATVLVPWLEASAWVRLAARGSLAYVFPQLWVAGDGSVRLVRTDRDADRRLHVRAWDADRATLLLDAHLTDEEYREEAAWPVFLGFPQRHVADAARRLEAAALWRPAYGWSAYAPTLVLGPDGPRRVSFPHRSETTLPDGRAEVRWRRLVAGDGRLVLETAATLYFDAPEVVGSIGPDGWADGPPRTEAERFSDATCSYGDARDVLRDLRPEALLLDPVNRAVVLVASAPDDDARPLACTVVPVPVAEPGLRPVPEFWFRPLANAAAPEAGRLLPLRTDTSLVFLDLVSGAATSLPLAPGEELGGWRHVPPPELPAVAVCRAPFGDATAHVRVRALPEGADEIVTTDLTLSPRTPLERLFGAVLGGVTLARPPLLTVTSCATPAPATWTELEARWWRDGVVAGGEGLPWLLGSLLVGVACALRNRRQARRRCASPAEIHAWTAAGLLLGPVGMAWMALLVRRSAVRAAPDGRLLAVHVPAGWRAPEPTGREVLLAERRAPGHEAGHRVPA